MCSVLRKLFTFLLYVNRHFVFILFVLWIMELFVWTFAKHDLLLTDFKLLWRSLNKWPRKKKWHEKLFNFHFGFKKIYMKKLEGMEGEIKNLFKKVYLFISLKKNVWCFTRNISRLFTLANCLFSYHSLCCVLYALSCTNHDQLWIDLLTGCAIGQWPGA